MMLFLCQHNCNYIIKKKKFFFICIFIRVTVQTGYFQPGHNPGQNRINRMKKKPGPIRVDPDEPETDRSTNNNHQNQDNTLYQMDSKYHHHNKSNLVNSNFLNDNGNHQVW